MVRNRNVIVGLSWLTAGFLLACVSPASPQYAKRLSGCQLLQSPPLRLRIESVGRAEAIGRLVNIRNHALIITAMHCNGCC
jgi:hypothetical protein